MTVNPYCPLPIYSNEYVRMYKGQSRDETRPHVFAMADEAFRNLVEEGENQSILVTWVSIHHCGQCSSADSSVQWRVRCRKNGEHEEGHSISCGSSHVRYAIFPFRSEAVFQPFAADIKGEPNPRSFRQCPDGQEQQLFSIWEVYSNRVCSIRSHHWCIDRLVSPGEVSRGEA